jgi:hypothetical protein
MPPPHMLPPNPMGARANLESMPEAAVSWSNLSNFNFGPQDFCFDIEKLTSPIYRPLCV